MNKCRDCGKEFEIKRKDKLRRKMILTLSRWAPSALKTVIQDAKNLCNECFRKQVKGAAEQTLDETGF